MRCYSGCGARDVLNALHGRGLLEEEHREAPRRDDRAPQPMVHNADPEALKIWVAASMGTGSIIERAYFPSRGITLPVPPSVRCGLRLHLDRYAMPAMVAAVQRPDGNVVAVQTTLLTASGKKATVSIPRVTIGSLGSGAVRLAKAGGVLGLAEGIETALFEQDEQ